MVIWKWTCRGEMQPQRRRHNGWTWPPSLLQLLLYVTIPIVASSTAFLVMPLHVLYAPVAVLIATIWLLSQIIILTQIDPAVSNLRKGQPPAHFDATKHEHVIENLFCNICRISVDANCKHCRQCNKCISGFDHHCEWLNNCIGSANYRLFLLLVLSVSFISALASTCLIALTAISFINIELLRDADKLPMKLVMWRGLCLAAIFLYAIVTITCSHLLYFHYKLWHRGMTTYHFIQINKKCKNDEEKRRKLSMDVNEIPALTQLGRTCSKLSTVKPRAVHDCNTDNPYVSFAFQGRLNNK